MTQTVKREDSNTINRFLAVAFAAVMVVSVLAVVPFAGAAQETKEDDKDVTIDSEVKNAEGTVEVFVLLEKAKLSPGLGEKSTVKALKQKATSSQKPLINFAQKQPGVEVLNRFWLVNGALVEVDKSKVSLDKIASVANVVGLHENSVRKLPPEPKVSNTDKETSSDQKDTKATYGLKQIKAPKTWKEYDTKGGQAKVAVLDTGVAASHPDINLYTEDPNDPTYPGGWAEFDQYGNIVPGSKPRDSDSHGTHTSGTVSGGDASGEYIGVAPNVKLMHGMVLPKGRGTTAQIVGGMQWATNEDADVISMSLGGGGFSVIEKRAIEAAEAAGTLVSVSAGNSGPGTGGTPGNIYESFTVGASNESRGIASFSSGMMIKTGDAWGEEANPNWPNKYIVPDISAPGVAVKSSVPGGQYAEFDGTSMAAPHVSGAAALLFSIARQNGYEPSVYEIKSALYTTASKPANRPSGRDIRYGNGIINVYEAADKLMNGKTVMGRVVDANGFPVSGAWVRTSNGAYAKTDSTGQFKLIANKNTDEVTVDAFGYASTTAKLKKGQVGVVAAVAALETNDKMISFGELQKAIQLWTSGEAVPGTGGETLTFKDLQKVIQLWAQDKKVKEAPSTTQVVLSPTTEAAHPTTPPGVVEGGESYTMEMKVSNVKKMMVELRGKSTVSSSDISVMVEGKKVKLGKMTEFLGPVTDNKFEITVKTDKGTSGKIGFKYTLSSSSGKITGQTGMTQSFKDVVDIAVVDSQGYHGDAITSTLNKHLPNNYRETVVTSTSAVRKGEFDAYVIQRLGPNPTFIQSVMQEAQKTGAVFLDAHAAQYQNRSLSGFADGITRLSQMNSDPKCASTQRYPYSCLGQTIAQSPPTSYKIKSDHPIFDGVGSSGDTVKIHGAVQGFSLPVYFGDYSGNVLATVTDSSGKEYGNSVAVDDNNNFVLMTLGRTYFVNDFTKEADMMFANAVKYVINNKGSSSQEETENQEQKDLEKLVAP